MLCITPLGFAQDITIRVMDVTNGHLLTDYQVSIWPLHAEQKSASTNTIPILDIKADNSGIVIFNLPEPIPQRLFIKIDIQAGRWRCGTVEFVDTQDVFRNGVVGLSPAPKRGKTDVVVKAMPGVIVFLARPMTFLERLLYPLVKS